MVDNEKYLQRGDAPVGAEVWQRLDEIVIGVCSSQLSARQLLEVEGPYGLGLKQWPMTDRVITENDVTMRAAVSQALVEIFSTFRLPARDIATFEQQGLSFGTDAIVQAALAVARKEDEVLLFGNEQVGLKGLLNAPGVQRSRLEGWDQLGRAVDNIIAAVTLLDNAGFHGPYSLALAPHLYNQLFRRYDNANITEFEHLRQLVTDRIVKSTALKNGGLLLQTGRPFASIILGQDLMTGFVGPAGRDYEFTISESLTLRLAEPRAVCVLEGP